MFPVQILAQCNTVLSLFSAAFYGRNDVQHLYKHGIKSCMMVDIDEPKLSEMVRRYGYDAICTDAINFIDKSNTKYDLVISDQFTNFDETIWSRYEKLKSLSNKYLLIGSGNDNLKNLPEGELIKRSDFKGGIYWHLTKI